VCTCGRASNNVANSTLLDCKVESALPIVKSPQPMGWPSARLLPHREWRLEDFDQSLRSRALVQGALRYLPQRSYLQGDADPPLENRQIASTHARFRCFPSSLPWRRPVLEEAPLSDCSKSLCRSCDPNAIRWS